MNRRTFLKGLAAAFVVPEVIVPERKVWALDQTMIRNPVWHDFSWRPMDKESYKLDVCTFDPHVTVGDYTITEAGEYNYFFKPSSEFTVQMQEPEGGFAKLPEPTYYNIGYDWDPTPPTNALEREMERLRKQIKKDLEIYLLYGPEGRE